MNIRTLAQQEPWQWPKEADQVFLQTLQDSQADAADRILAAELAGDPVAMSDDLALTFLSIVGNSREPEEFRRQAAISLGPVLELADIDEFDDPEFKKTGRLPEKTKRALMKGHFHLARET